MTKKYAKLGNGEFGECYHAVLARLLNEDFFPEFENFEDGKVFCETVADYPNKPPTAEKIHLGSTANWIFNDFHEGIQSEVLQKIEKKAKDEKWVLPDEFSKYITNDKKLLVWLRSKAYKPERNISVEAIEQITELCRSQNTLPIFVGPKVIGMNNDAVGLWDFYKNEWFNNDSIAKQLWLLNMLHTSGGVIGSIGMMSGAMDGLAFFCGRKVVFLARKKDASPRMAKVSQVIPTLDWVECYFNDTFQTLEQSTIDELRRRLWGEQAGAVNVAPRRD